MALTVHISFIRKPHLHRTNAQLSNWAFTSDKMAPAMVIASARHARAHLFVTMLKRLRRTRWRCYRNSTLLQILILLLGIWFLFLQMFLFTCVEFLVVELFYVCWHTYLHARLDTSSVLLLVYKLILQYIDRFLA